MYKTFNYVDFNDNFDIYVAFNVGNVKSKIKMLKFLKRVTKTIVFL